MNNKELLQYASDLANLQREYKRLSEMNKYELAGVNENQIQLMNLTFFKLFNESGYEVKSRENGYNLFKAEMFGIDFVTLVSTEL